MDTSADGAAAPLFDVDTVLAWLANEKPLRGDKARLTTHLKLVAEHAIDQGLTYEQLDLCVQAATAEWHTQATQKALIRALIPQGIVSSNLLIDVISKLGLPHVPLGVKCLFIQWLVLMLDFVDTKEPVMQLYGLLFYWIDYETMRPHLCHLLYLITQREHVVGFRVRRLMHLQRRVGVEPCITALLNCYKVLQPSIVSIVVPASARKRWFPAIDKGLRTGFEVLTQRQHIAPIEAISVNGIERVHMPDIPEVHASLLVREKVRQPVAQIGLEGADIDQGAGSDEANSLHVWKTGEPAEVVAQLSRLSFPAQLAAVLTSKQLQHALSVAPNPMVLQRLGFWLSARLVDDHALFSGEEDSSFHRLLQALISFCSFMDETSFVVDSFLIPFLKRWNSSVYQKEILTLITFIPPMPFYDLETAILKPLSALLPLSPVSTQCAIIACFEGILVRYATYNWRTFYSTPPPSEQDSQPKGSLVLHPPHPQIDPDTDYIRTLRDFVNHIDSQCSLCLALHPRNDALLNAILTFFERTSRLCTSDSLPLIVIPSPSIVYGAMLGTSAASFSRICGILASAREEYSRFNDLNPEDLYVPKPETIHYLDKFNSYIVDIANMVWRGKILNTKEGEDSCVLDEASVKQTRVLEGLSAGDDRETKKQELRELFRQRILSALNPEVIGKSSVENTLTLSQGGWFASMVAGKEGWSKKQLILHLKEDYGLDGLARFLAAFIASLKI
eukprot:m.55979 g.55979  ORF g.55979 m.55979 type:complete len:731 (-) comp11533_c0_seq3:243-2435(-)